MTKPTAPVTDLTPYEHPFEQGQVLVRQGEGSDVLFVVRRGLVRLERHHDGHTVCRQTLKQGDIFAEQAVFGDTPASFTATAQSDGCCLKLDATTLVELIERSPEFSSRLLHQMSLKLNRAWVQVDRAQTRSPSERLKRRLFELAEQVGQPGPKGTFIARRLSEVAAEVGVRDEDAGWFASEQIKAGLLRVNRSGLWVVDPAQWEVV